MAAAASIAPAAHLPLIDLPNAPLFPLQFDCSPRLQLELRSELKGRLPFSFLAI